MAPSSLIPQPVEQDWRREGTYCAGRISSAEIVGRAQRQCLVVGSTEIGVFTTGDF